MNNKSKAKAKVNAKVNAKGRQMQKQLASGFWITICNLKLALTLHWMSHWIELNWIEGTLEMKIII